MNRFARRTFLRGAGVAVTVPWMDSLAPRSASAASSGPLRYMPIFLPMGASESWKPTATGVGAAWQLPGILEPLLPLKSKITVLSNFENGTSFNADGSSSVEPSHGRQPGAWLNCIDPRVTRAMAGPGAPEMNRTSTDQLMAQVPAIVGNTPIKSLQVGLSTWFSDCDQGSPCSDSRTISWSDTMKPMYKSVDPLEVFNKLVGVVSTTPGGMPDPGLQKRIALNKSILDAVAENSARTQNRLGKGDKARMEGFLTNVRAVEKQATSMSLGMGGLACTPIAKPMYTGPILPNGAKSNSATYDKGTHADMMNDLIVMAFQCDATRLITHMLEDERSEFSYGHVPVRKFTATSSTVATGVCGEWHNNGQHGSNDVFASIIHWNVGKVANLMMRLDAIKEGDKSILDNSVIMFGTPMAGFNDHACNKLKMMLIGGGAGKLKTDQHIDFTKRWLRDLHITLMKGVFGMTGPAVDDFGIARANNPQKMITEILA